MSNISKIKIKNADGTEKEYNVSDSNIGTKIGNLEELTTEDKSSLVNAINEVKASAGGSNASLPVGVIMPIASPIVPEKWFLCDGSEVSRETYSVLFSAIGETYGVGDGTTTFNLPDMRYRVPVGEIKDTATLYSQASATIKYLRLVPTAELSNYDVDDIIEYNGETRVITEITTSTNYIQFSLETTFGVVITKDTEVVLRKKFGSTGGEKAHKLTVNELPSHTHSVLMMENVTSMGMESASGKTQKPTASTSGATGGGQAHNNMPPYITMNYIIYAGV